ncbi:MAG: hypothetical protein HY720_16785 [Planctomycetes bacterium]|nr:hypothetical protein [Planctomycetota bacterium]
MEQAQPVHHGGGINVPALIGLILGILAVLASFIPFCGGCVAIPMAVVALILGLVGFATAKKHDSGKGLAMGATIVAILSVLISSAWWGWAYLEGQKQQEKEKEEQAKIHGLNEEMEMDTVKWTVTEAKETGGADKSVVTIRVTMTNGNAFFVDNSVSQDHFALIDKGTSAQTKPLAPFAASMTLNTAQNLEMQFEVAANHGELHLKITSPIDGDNFRNVKIVPVKAPALPGPEDEGG